MLYGVVPILQQVDVHQESFAATSGVLQTEFVQIVITVERHVGVIVPMAVETLNKCIEFVQQSFAITENPFQVDLYE